MIAHAHTPASAQDVKSNETSNIEKLWPGSLSWLWQTKKSPADGPRHYEVFAGADAATTVWLVYSGATVAPFGDIHEEGLRLRFSGGYGQYTYTSHETIKPFRKSHHRAATHYQEAMIGYLWRLDPLIAKVFVGAAQIDHQIYPYDELNIVQGVDFGVKGAIELWFNIGDSAWASLDMAWAQAHNSRSARGRIGYKIMPWTSVGVETAINVDAQAEIKIGKEAEAQRSTAMDFARVGGFVRFDWYGGEASASAGLLGDFTNEKSPYVTVNWIKQF